MAKKDIIGTKHNLIIYEQGKQSQALYVVRDVVGLEKNIPNQKPTVYLSYCGGRPTAAIPAYVTMTLEMLKADGEPLTESDVFWKGEKQYQEQESEFVSNE
jgi:hypothetical protein